MNYSCVVVDGVARIVDQEKNTFPSSLQNGWDAPQSLLFTIDHKKRPSASNIESLWKVRASDGHQLSMLSLKVQKFYARVRANTATQLS